MLSNATLPPETCTAIVWDIETFPNCFQFGWEDLDSDARGLFELSDRRNDHAELFAFLTACYNRRIVFIGFNSLFFDYPVLHSLMLQPDAATAEAAYAKAQQIIASQNGNKWSNMVWPDQRFFQQIDLFATNHFDNVAKMTSLKALQFAMRAESIEELPFEVGTVLTPEQMDKNGAYCLHDVSETKRFAHLCKAELDFRWALVPDYGTEVLNWSDGKIGRQQIIRTLGDEACYIKERGKRRQPRGTPRTSIVVSEILFPYIQFQRPECCNVLQAFREKKIDAARPGAISNISCELDGFAFYFGVGGVHGSLDKRIVRSDADHLIIDVDVASLYPSIEIENGMYPEHLGPGFVDVLRGIRDQRFAAKAAGDKVAVQILKYALNVPYGDSNNAYSPLYDPKYTMQTTINGQLLLLMLAERLTLAAPIELIQINTDGLTFRVHKDHQAAVAGVCAEWQRLTKLVLEYKLYDMIAVRDVNNYIAVDTKGEIKRKGAYDYPPERKDYAGWWFRDYSGLVIPRAAEAALVRGEDVAAFIHAHTDPFDFMLRAKTPRSSQLVFDPDFIAENLPRVTRYFAARADLGSKIVKQSPPVEGATPGHFKRKNAISDGDWFKGLRETPTETVDGLTRPAWNEAIHTKNKSTYDERTMSVHPCALPCLDMRGFKWEHLDREWYVTEARKLVECFRAS